MLIIDLSKAKSEKNYHIGDKIIVNDLMQKNYHYLLTAPMGQDFDIDFKPELSPAEMLKLGVFEGKYLNDCFNEFPREWYENATESLSPAKPNISKNFFKIKSRQSLQIWRENGWILPNDPDVRGWFLWYCRYYLGRRDESVDKRQIKRWRAFRRHVAQIKNNCFEKDLDCRKRQRQALLQWAYNPFI